ncbi:unnamed protein product [Schistosoma margrebowiei]|uniref:Uncharacterized protein n=1 Tax=Schistosoma margrebowiei TaxID=48269 RepID=A0AA84ZDI0_9TREM|nr:unnamed protein product [Schistosoma margrebowiei]
MRQSTNSFQEQNEKAMSADSMFLIALLSYTLINHSVSCKYYERSHNGTNVGVNYSGKDTAIGHGACIDDFKKSGLRRISSIQKCVYKKNETV